LSCLDIIVRTCDRTNVHNDWRKRYCGFDKNVLLIGCIRSLIRSVLKTQGIDVSVTVLDDHSSTETVEHLQRLLCHLPQAKFIPLEEFGYNYSAHQQWLMCRDSKADLVYSVEDDYLHVDTAIQEMVDSFEFFRQRIKNDDIVLYPFDKPTEYNPPTRRDFIVHGSARHWRTGVYTTNTIMTKPKIFRVHWSKFETLALKYNGDYLNPRVEHFDEANTIQPIWEQGHAIRFNPIPSLALHMQFDQEKDPWIDWMQWWDNFADAPLQDAHM
jgi:glycosyltransferase involved in cell wall biosynthesis